MKIGGLQKFSLIEFTSYLSCIVFVRGCNFRCPFCHNPELVLPEKFGPLLDNSSVLAFLEKRKNQIEGVVITGGEPFSDEDLLSFLKKVKDMGYAVKVDTNGSFPDKLERAIKEKLIDYVAMDIKAPPKKYRTLSDVDVDIERIKRSISLIMNSGVFYEFRTTVIKELLDIPDFEEIGKLVEGAKMFYLQRFVPSKAIDPLALSFHTYSDEELEKIKGIMLKYVKECVIR